MSIAPIADKGKAVGVASADLREVKPLLDSGDDDPAVAFDRDGVCTRGAAFVRYAAPAEARVEAPARSEPDDCCAWKARTCPAGGDDLAVKLECDRLGDVVIVAPGPGHDLAASAERRIEAAIWRVAGEREQREAPSGGDDLPIGLNC